jgi:2-C-methyl-D-erythritol 4-phosphate cytidylyltransferase
LLELSIAALRASEILTGIVVAVRAEDVEGTEHLLAPIASQIPLKVVAGGETRQDSVYLALQEVPQDSDIVMVHDAARPFVKAEEVRLVCEKAMVASAAILARPVASTLKRGDDERFIQETVNRESLWEAQTPQVARTALLCQAYEKSREDGFIGTDDSQLIERLGQPVSLVMGSGSNFKVTHPDDIELAQALIART